MLGTSGTKEQYNKFIGFSFRLKYPGLDDNGEARQARSTNGQKKTSNKSLLFLATGKGAALQYEKLLDILSGHSIQIFIQTIPRFPAVHVIKSKLP